MMLTLHHGGNILKVLEIYVNDEFCTYNVEVTRYAVHIMDWEPFDRAVTVKLVTIGLGGSPDERYYKVVPENDREVVSEPISKSYKEFKI